MLDWCIIIRRFLYIFFFMEIDSFPIFHTSNILTILVNKIYIDNRVHIRHIMLYNYQKEWKATQPFSDLNESFGEGIISESKCRE